MPLKQAKTIYDAMSKVGSSALCVLSNKAKWLELTWQGSAHPLKV